MAVLASFSADDVLADVLARDMHLSGRTMAWYDRLFNDAMDRLNAASVKRCACGTGFRLRALPDTLRRFRGNVTSAARLRGSLR